MAMNIPLTKNEIMDILHLGSMPRNWKSQGLTISTYHGAYAFESGYALSMFADGLKKLMELKPAADHESLFLLMFKALSMSVPNLYVKVGN